MQNLLLIDVPPLSNVTIWGNSGQRMKNIEVYMPIIYEARERQEPDSDWRPAEGKRNLYWSKRSSNSNLLTLMNYLMKMNNKKNQRIMYWNKRSDNFPTLPFSTIIWNVRPKKNGYFRVAKR